MISKPPALLFSWPQLLRADQKFKRACCESRAPQIALCLPSVRHGGQIPFGESSVVVTALVSVMITYRQRH